MEPTQKKFFCNKCRQFTNHSLLHKEERRETDTIEERWHMETLDGYYIQSCLGCEEIHFLYRQEYSQDNSDKEVEESRYPPMMMRPKPRWIGDVFDTPFWTGDSFIEKTIEEIYIALSNNCPQLAAMGIRALLESIIIDKVNDHGTFKNNLEEFLKAGHITAAQKERLTHVLEVGNATMHRQYIPDYAALNTSLDIVELLIEGLYVHDGKAESMRKGIPPRGSKGSE